MDLHHGLAMTPEMRAELIQLREASRDARRVAQLRAALATKGHIVPDTAPSSGITMLQVDQTRRLAKDLSPVFRRKVNAALDVVVERAAGLIELAVDLELFTLRTWRASATPSPMMWFDRSSEHAAVLQRAGARIVAALDEISERVELEKLRSAADVDAGWFRRRAARRAAAAQLTVELALFLEALTELPELSSVELAAEELLAVRTAAKLDVEAVSRTG